MFVDAIKAHLNLRLKGDEMACVNFPGAWCESGKFGQPKRWLYGMRPAARLGARPFQQVGRVRDGQREVRPTVFCEAERDIRCVVHCDDFMLSGWEKGLDSALVFLKWR